jgi:FAD/FMN-containing dehydrogenase
LGGSISSCHGVGIEHRDNLDLEFSKVALDVMRALKKTLDPDNIMNPGKKIPMN